VAKQDTRRLRDPLVALIRYHVVKECAREPRRRGQGDVYERARREIQQMDQRLFCELEGVGAARSTIIKSYNAIKDSPLATKHKNLRELLRKLPSLVNGGHDPNRLTGLKLDQLKNALDAAERRTELDEALTNLIDALNVAEYRWAQAAMRKDIETAEFFQMVMRKLMRRFHGKRAYKDRLVREVCRKHKALETR
jgi:hypothetical protein